MELLIALLVLLSGGLIGILFSFLHDTNQERVMQTFVPGRAPINTMKTTSIKYASWRR